MVYGCRVPLSILAIALACAAGPPHTAGAQTPAGATTCELTFAVAECPAHPTLGFTRRKVIVDDFDGAGSSQQRCLRRANEYHFWCKSVSAITATFLKGGKVVASEKYPK